MPPPSLPFVQPPCPAQPYPTPPMRPTAHSQPLAIESADTMRACQGTCWQPSNSPVHRCQASLRLTRRAQTRRVAPPHCHAAVPTRHGLWAHRRVQSSQQSAWAASSRQAHPPHAKGSRDRASPAPLRSAA
eukprot:7389687-Prymnesium_polylepis.4